MFTAYYSRILSMFLDEDPMFLVLLWNAYCKYTGQDRFTMEPMDTLDNFMEEHDLTVWDIIDMTDTTPNFKESAYIGIDPRTDKPVAYREKPTAHMMQLVATAAAFALIGKYADPVEELRKIDMMDVAACFPGDPFLDEIIEENK